MNGGGTDEANAPKNATGIVASQKTASMKVGDTRDVTIASDPADATNADAVVASTVATSSDQTVITVAPKADTPGTFTITALVEGSGNVSFASNDFTAAVAVTVAAAS